jgi:hypothetical protein
VTLDSRGFVYLRLDRPELAIADYDAALAQRPTAATSLYGRGLAHLRQRDLADGARDIEAAERIRPDIAAQFRRWGMTTP